MFLFTKNKKRNMRRNGNMYKALTKKLSLNGIESLLIFLNKLKLNKV